MYISVSGLAIPDEVLIRLTDDEGAGSVNASRAESAISVAQAIVDCSLSRTYGVPFAAAPELVKKLTGDLAVYNLYQRIGPVPEEIRAGYENALSLLEKAASGLISLWPEVPQTGPRLSCQDREFTREYMGGF